MIHPSELVLNLIEVYEIGNGVSMGIGRVSDVGLFFNLTGSLLN